MKQIKIKIINAHPLIKWKVDHDADEMITKLPKSEWKNHKTVKIKVSVDGSSQIFFTDLEEWSLDDYTRQWREGLRRLKNNDKTCLILNVYSVKGNPGVTWCLIYKINNYLHVQLRSLISKDYKTIVESKTFTPDTCYNFIPPRQTHEDDGEEIPESIVPYE